MTTLLLSGLAVTAAVSASLTAAVIPLLRRARAIDVPGDRSLHRLPVPAVVDSPSSWPPRWPPGRPSSLRCTNEARSTR